MPYVVNSPLTLQRHSYTESFRVRCECLMESKSWSGMRCFLLYFFFDLRCRLTLCLNAAIHKYTQISHIIMHVLYTRLKFSKNVIYEEKT